MINLNRVSPTPASLQTPKIQEYILAVAAFIADPVVNPKPNPDQDYRNSDLLESFDNDFHSKCYLTERKFANSCVMDIEQFIPQVEAPALIYTWTNLYPADPASNQMKPRKTPAGGYLKPCDPADDIESEITCTSDIIGDNPEFLPTYNSNVRAVNTCSLLNRLHNGHDAKTKQKTADLRNAIIKKRNEILNKIIDWLAAPEGQQKIQIERDLRDLLSRKGSFTMLSRAIPAVVQHVPARLFD